MTPLEASIKHWEENLVLAKHGRLEIDDIISDKCALCMEYACEECPLGKAGYGCYEANSPWNAISLALRRGDKEEAAAATARLLETLRSLKDEA